MNATRTVATLSALLGTFILGWLVGSGSSTTPPPPESLVRLVPEPEVPCHPLAAPATSYEPTREVVVRTPVDCPQCGEKDEQIAKFQRELDATRAALTQSQQALASAQMQLEWRPYLQELTQTLTDWKPDELQSVFVRSKLFPQTADLYTAQGFVRGGQLTAASLLEIAEEASRVDAERQKAALLEGEQKSKQLEQFEKRARTFIEKLQQRGLGFFAENFRAGVGLN